MAITGGIKFFKQSKALFVNDGTAVASTNTEAAKNVLSSNKFIRWTSSGSDDTTTETITITFPSATIDRVFLIDTNFKEFTIKYDVGGTPTDFTDVLGLDGSQSVIAETVYARDTAYYEVDPVTTTKIYITATKSQVVDAEKSLERFYATEEIGTFQGYPLVTPETLNPNINQQKVLSGNLNVQKRLETFECGLKFKNYPPIQNDYDITLDIQRRTSSFLIWLCGGKFGTSFNMVRENWDLKNVYNVQAVGKLSPRWNNGIYLAGFSGSIKINQATEVI
jgi:hypothetical protein